MKEITVDSNIDCLPPFGARETGHFNRSIPMVPSSEYTRLYRVQPSTRGNASDWVKEAQQASGHTEAEGRWFVSNPSMLDWYKDDLGPNAITYYVDVPSADLERYRVSNCTEQLGHRPVKSYSRDPENEFFLPRELADKAQPEKSDFDRMLDEYGRPDSHQAPGRDGPER